MRRVGLTILVFGLMASTAIAQSSSMWLLPVSDQQARSETGVGAGAPAGFSAAPPREESTPSTRSIEAVSLIAIPRVPPRKFKPHDLVTIIVKQAKKRESDAKLDTEKKWNINGKLSEWFRFYEDHKLGTDNLPRGQPGFKFQYNNKYENDAQSDREDRFETRIQALVIDVKPNGNLVLEAQQHETHDEEVIEITLTGECRSEDVTPANTILSTQVARMVLVEKNTGAVRDATTRGWIPRLLDWTKPF